MRAATQAAHLVKGAQIWREAAVHAQHAPIYKSLHTKEESSSCRCAERAARREAAALS